MTEIKLWKYLFRSTSYSRGCADVYLFHNNVIYNYLFVNISEVRQDSAIKTYVV